ncbi:hypothetical protein CKALI_00505 [Corynebacterium kalinowskii]|uniref:DUF559 domain-containing protein n=1 Tax=Corynebacterium kalinowskii TaxID=2675216 RepID=A0A6B8V792_9CORY|nr:hypothetical protein [Corynebacterium kalinowskii]QGU01002.1 hypothetical protein CKALI_00505 [Corynebacterium kalinowskii]
MKFGKKSVRKLVLKIHPSPITLFDHRSKNLDDYAFWHELNTKRKTQVYGHFYANADQFHSLPPWEKSRVRALACGLSAHSAVVVSLAAARLWGMDTLAMYSFPELSPFAGKPAPSRSQWAKTCTYRYAKLPASSVVAFKNLRVATPERAVIDTARWHSFAEALTVADHYLTAVPHKKKLWAELDKIGRAKGSARARRMIKEARFGIDSAAESWARAQILDSDLPYNKLETQREVYAKGEKFYLDIVLDDFLVIEVDGRKKYQGDEDEIHRISADELQREKQIKNKGYEVVRCDWAMLRDDQLIPTLREIYSRPSRRPSRLNFS